MAHARSDPSCCQGSLHARDHCMLSQQDAAGLGMLQSMKHALTKWQQLLPGVWHLEAKGRGSHSTWHAFT